jgi:hypothetical protein
MLGSLSRQPQGVGSLPEKESGTRRNMPSGLRYFLHGSRLPGCPDLVLPARKAVVRAWVLLAPQPALRGWPQELPPQAFEASAVMDGGGAARRRHRAVSLEEPPSHLSRDVPHPDISAWTFDQLRAHHIGISGCRSSGLTLRLQNVVRVVVRRPFVRKMLEVEYRLNICFCLAPLPGHVSNHVRRPGSSFSAGSRRNWELQRAA